MEKRKSIYMQRWLSFHFYSTPLQSDYYYLKLCNEIYNMLRDDDFPDEEISISDEQKKNLACFVTGYFEDVISGPGLWKAFITQVSELYGTYLPFFDPDPEEYFPDEINPEDIHFLLWYYLSMVLSDDSIISPLIYEWSDYSNRIFEILEREYETAPENFNLKQLFNVSPEENNFFMIKEKLKWIMLDSWLHHFLGKELEEITDDTFIDDEEKPMPEESRAIYLYDTMDTFVLSRHTPLLARQGKEWLAYALGKDHPLYESLLEMGEKKSGFYLYIGTKGDDLLFEHIATGTRLKVTSRSMDVPTGNEPGRSISFAGFVKWRGEWWFSGSQLGWGYDNDLIRKEQESEKSKMLFGKNPAVQREENRQLYRSFLKFNKGKPLAFIESEEAANSFIRDFLAYHNRSLKKSVRKQRKDRMPLEQDMLPDSIFKEMEPDLVQVETIPGVVFCDPDSGIDLAFGYNDMIPDARNQWYMSTNTEDDPGDGTMILLESPHINGKLMHYLVSNYDLPGLEFPGLSGRELLLDNFDFMLRFWKRKRYYS
ncbi:MAG: DUF3843 family protein [Bacteroidales bacterium]|nr:DUF3843 family protein [Bacteroidales bacterium]